LPAEPDQIITGAGSSTQEFLLATLMNGQRYAVRPAITEAEQQKGLGGLHILPADQGMLFLFPQSQELCFWMKDMHFPIDIIWLSTDKRVTFIKSSVSPDTYPASFCATGRYVLELNAGQAARNHLLLGQQVSF